MFEFPTWMDQKLQKKPKQQIEILRVEKVNWKPTVKLQKFDASKFIKDKLENPLVESFS